MYTVIDSYSISQNQYPNSISIIVLYCIVLYCIIYRFNNGFTNVNNHPISIDSNHSIVSLSNPILLFMIIMIMIMIIRSKQFPINIEQILVQTYSNHHLYIIIIIIGRLDSSFVNVQYVIIGSLVIIIMIENNDWLIDWLIETTIIIEYHC